MSPEYVIENTKCEREYFIV